MQSLLFGLLMWVTGGRSLYQLPDWWITLRNVLPFEWQGQAFQLGLPLLILLLIAALTAVILNKTHLGRQLYAVGGDAESARRIGIRVGLISLFAYGWLGPWPRLADWFRSTAWVKSSPTPWWVVSWMCWRQPYWAEPV